MARPPLPHATLSTAPYAVLTPKHSLPRHSGLNTTPAAGRQLQAEAPTLTVAARSLPCNPASAVHMHVKKCHSQPRAVAPGHSVLHLAQSPADANTPTQPRPQRCSTSACCCSAWGEPSCSQRPGARPNPVLAGAAATPTLAGSAVRCAARGAACPANPGPTRAAAPARCPGDSSAGTRPCRSRPWTGSARARPGLLTSTSSMRDLCRPALL